MIAKIFLYDLVGGIIDRYVFLSKPTNLISRPALIPIVRFILLFLLAGVASCTFSEPYCENEDCLNASLDAGPVDYRILLIGDTGANVDLKKPDRPAKISLFASVQRVAELMPTRTAIVFLGDIIYSKGLPDVDEKPVAFDADCKGRVCAEKRIDVQIEILKNSKARGIFVPGNHDWDSGGKKGWQRILNLEKYIDNSRKDADVIMIPNAGCPGPKTEVLSGNEAEIALIGLDTQWWLHKYKKPETNDNPGNCQTLTEKEVIHSLKKQIEEGIKNNRHILLVAHHPLISYGKHSGYYNYKDLLHPIDLFSQFIITLGFSGRQEILHPVYRHMRKKIQGAIQSAVGEGGRPLIYAAGHDHSLQVIEGLQGIMYLVSGAGTPWKASRVRHEQGTLFSHSNKVSGGFMAVDYMQSGKVRLVVIEPPADGEVCEHGEGRECVVFSTWLS
jgi:calcineurin-like phosphoesterase family protein